MINLRYHIVSLTAVFLAIGIGLTLGSTFLDRATVDNLNGQLDNLQQSLEERDARIGDLQDEVQTDEQVQAALDEQATGLLADRLEGVPVVVVSARGVDEADVRGSLQALVVAGADVQGLWWFTDRFGLDDAAAVDDLAAILDDTSTDPSRLRRTAIDALGGELRARQLAVVDPDGVPDDDPATVSTTPDQPAVPATDPAGVPETGVPEDGQPGGAPDGAPSGEEIPGAATPSRANGPITILDALTEAGFIEFEVVPGGPDRPTFRAGTRMVLIGGSRTVPDDLVIERLVERMGRATDVPILAVAGSASGEEGAISDLVAMIRQDEQLRELVPTVDDLEHFEGWAAMVLALGDVGEGLVGHYGVGDGATRLLPPLRMP